MDTYISKLKTTVGWAWKYTHVIRRLRRKDHKFEANLVYIVRFFLKSKNLKTVYC
jgi:hypothetical protein